MSIAPEFFESHSIDVSDLAARLDAAGDVATFSAALAALVEGASSWITIPAMVDDTAPWS